MTVHQLLAEWSSWGWPLLANHLWQATLISIVALLAGTLLKNAPGKARYALWLIASLKFAIPSALLIIAAGKLGVNFFSIFDQGADRGEGLTIIYQLTTPAAPVIASTGPPAADGSHNELLCALTILWFTGFVVLLAAWLRRRRRFTLAMRRTPSTDASRENLALARVSLWLSIRRDVRLLVLPETIEPGVWGVFRPVVFLPESMAEDLSEAELEAVMMHEMIHVERWDNLVSNLHRFLCCLLWFHPVVWLLDRLLLAERERACDEEVLRLGAGAEIYASSLLKVLRFCLGWTTAGASNVSGSNLGRRVERIMSKSVRLQPSLLQRAAVISIGVLAVALSITAGLMTRQSVAAQAVRPARPAIIGDDRADLKLFERLDRAPLVALEFRNSAKTPLVINEAGARAVLLRPEEPGDEYAVLPVITVTNNTDKRIRGFTVDFRNGTERRAYFEKFASPIEPHGVYTSGVQKRFVLIPGGPTGWTVRVSGVAYDDGEIWGMVPPPPPPPPPPQEMLKLDQAAEKTIRFSNVDDAPVSISSAPEIFMYRLTAALPNSTKEASTPAARWSSLIQLKVPVTNNTDRRIATIALSCTTPESTSVSYVPFALEPRSTSKLRVPIQDGGFIVVHGNPDQMEAKVVGVVFEDGETWGKFPGPPAPPPPPIVPTTPPALVRKAGGAMAMSAIHRVDADYPALAKAAQISGTVVVEVTVDENGRVTAARAISGHPLLKDAAVTAARQWLFSPTLLSGTPVPVVGTLTFNFEF